MTSTNLQPFVTGNRAAVRHGVFVTKLDDDERAEVAEVRAELAHLTPARGVGVGPLLDLTSMQAWRLRRAYADLARNGLVRSGGKAAPILHHLQSLERAFVENLERLALTPAAAVRLGLDLVRAREANLAALTQEERTQLEALLAKAGAIDA